MRGFVLRALLLAVLVAAPLAAAHGGASGLPGDTLARATHLGSPPARAFDLLDAGESHYARVAVRDDGPVRVRLFAPSDAVPSSLVLVLVFGPGLPADTPVPPDVERPPGMGALVFPANAREEVVDWRVPARRTLLLDRTLELAAEEHVVVVRAEGAARVALMFDAPGSAWVDTFLLAGARAEERAWSGVPAWTSYVVGGIAVVPVALVAWRWRPPAWPLLTILGLFAAALFAASLGLLALDAARARVTPWLLASVTVAATGAALWAAFSSAPNPARRIALGLAAVAGAALWVGFLWGPVAALAGALLPEPSHGKD